MHIVAVAYTVFALMCAQNALLAFSLFATPKSADKPNILFITTLHYTLAIPFAAFVALTFAYLTWHYCPAIRALLLWIFGFSCAALAHTLFYSLRALIDHFYSPFTSALCYLSRFGCLSISITLAITNRLVKYTFILSTLSHSFLARIAKYFLPNHRAK